jgi:hypothetical protein
MKAIGLWQGVAMESLKFHPGPLSLTLLRPTGGQPAAVFYPFGHPTPYAYDETLITCTWKGREDKEIIRNHRGITVSSAITMGRNLPEYKNKDKQKQFTAKNIRFQNQNKVER